MSQRHKINQASIEFNFNRISDAETFESRAGQWVIQQLLPVIESVFDDVCSPQQTLIINTLTLDLGEFNSKTFYAQVPEKLKQQLRERLRLQLHMAIRSQEAQHTDDLKCGSKQTAATPDKTTLISPRVQRWNMLWQFLSTGVLPWSVSPNPSLEALGLSAALSEHTAQLINALSKAHQPETVLRRVVEQFPAASIADLFRALTPGHQWLMMSFLLTHPKSSARELTPLLAQAWYVRFAQLFTRHDLSSLSTLWEKIIPSFAPQLIKALYQRHTDSQLPWDLVRHLNENERLLLLSVLTPQEYPFLSAILRAPDLWQLQHRPDNHSYVDTVSHTAKRADPIARLPHSQLQQHLWHFTLHFLLVDRGSTFNRQSYMSGLIIRMANAHNQSADTLTASLISALESTAIDSTLRMQLLGLLHTLQPVIDSKAHSRHAASESPVVHHPVAENRLPYLNELTIALCSGEEDTLLQYWPNVLPPFAALLRWCGQLDNVRRHWSESYSDNTLMALVKVLVSQAARFISTLLVEKRLFIRHNTAVLTERTVGIRLWKLTFDFLIAENNGAFNKQSYLDYLIQQLASSRNIGYSELLENLRDDATIAGDYSQFGVTIRAMMHDLSRSSRTKNAAKNGENALSHVPSSCLKNLSSAQLADLEKIIVTLQNANQNQWNQYIHQWLRDYAQPLPLIIRDLGSSSSVLTRWIAHFDDLALLSITAIVNPQAKETVHGIINEQGRITEAARCISSPFRSIHTRNALWELTLHYLLSRRGSEFNQYQYLLSITGQLSARYQIKTEVLIVQWLNLSDRGFLWRQQLIDLVAHHQQTPVTSPLLLAEIQSRPDAPVLDEQQRALLHRYVTVNASMMATQLQTWTPPQLARLVRTLQPQRPEHIIALVPLLLAIVHHFKLAPHWFYVLLFSRDCPATPEQWLQQLLRQIAKHHTSSEQAYYPQFQQFVLGSRDLVHNQTQRQQWLDRILPKEDLQARLQQWLEGKSPAPEAALLHRAQQNSLRQWLCGTLANPRYLQRWVQTLSPETHQALLFPSLTHAAIALLALRHAFCRLFATQQQGELLFWQTLYRQHWLKGLAMTGSQLMQHVLIELHQLWRTHTSQSTTSYDAPVSELTNRLLPWVSSSSLQKTLTQVASQRRANRPDRQRWVAQLNRQFPEIKQLIEAIEMPEMDVNKSAGIPWNDKQDETEPSGDPVTIHNAGLVIASTYIPILFQRLALTSGHKFADTEAQHQALFCLQWMTNGTNSAPEYQLLLNKVLCGIEPSAPVPQQVPLPNGAETVIDGLLTAIISHWRVLGNTSISGLQSTFIQREGLLTFTPKHWQLNIVPSAFDMLLDQLPWSFQTIKYPWMDKPLFVSWR